MSDFQADLPRELGGGRYEVNRVFADSGGMGIVLEATDRRCADNPVLIKTTRYDGGRHARHFHYSADDAGRHVRATRKILEWEKKVLVRFRNEGLNNLPSVNDFFYDRTLTLKPRYDGKHGAFDLPEQLLEEEPYLVIERIPGDVLEKRAREPDFRDNLDDNVMSLARELLTVFIRFHKSFDVGGREACFIYQDLKPANVLVSQEASFTLIDLGAMTLRLGDKTTEPTAGCITIGYAAPEAAAGGEARIDARFDIYTLGATLWHVVTGQDPREMGEEFPVLDPSRLTQSGLSPASASIIARSLHRDVTARYQTAAEMRRDVIARLRDLRS